MVYFSDFHVPTTTLFHPSSILFHLLEIVLYQLVLKQLFLQQHISIPIVANNSPLSLQHILERELRSIPIIFNVLIWLSPRLGWL